MKSIIFSLLFLLSSLSISAQSLGMQHLGAIGGELIDPQGNSLIHGIGAVGSTVIENGVRLDQGMFLACDLSCLNYTHSIETALYKNPVLSIYPNPTDQFIHFEGEAQLIFRYELFNVTGQQLAAHPILHSRISLEGLPPGVYSLRVYGRDGDLSLIGKVMKR